jgi:hypothetical protein
MHSSGENSRKRKNDSVKRGEYRNFDQMSSQMRDTLIESYAEKVIAHAAENGGRCRLGFVNPRISLSHRRPPPHPPLFAVVRPQDHAQRHVVHRAIVGAFHQIHEAPPIGTRGRPPFHRSHRHRSRPRTTTIPSSSRAGVGNSDESHRPTTTSSSRGRRRRHRRHLHRRPDFVLDDRGEGRFLHGQVARHGAFRFREHGRHRRSIAVVFALAPCPSALIESDTISPNSSRGGGWYIPRVV